jgi:site-specific DNA-methyltransferase (adenine-specific)
MISNIYRMPKYTCERCLKEFSQKSSYDKHQHIKKPCQDNSDRIEEIVENTFINEKLIPNNDKDKVIHAMISTTQENTMENEFTPTKKTIRLKCHSGNQVVTQHETTSASLNSADLITDKETNPSAKDVKTTLRRFKIVDTKPVENELKFTRDYINAQKKCLIHGNCLDVMKNIEDKSIDLILCDLPYGVTKNKWDVIIPFNEMWLQYNRIIKDNGAIILFGSQPFTTMLISSNMTYFRYCLVWEKNKFSDFLNSKRKPMKTNEDICIFYKKQPTYNIQYWYSTPYERWNTQQAVDKQSNYGSHKQNVAKSDGKRLPTTVLKFNRVERPKHPTQKPVDLLEWLIKSYSNEGEIVLDNCMGVGSTGLAAKNLNRNFVGIELDDEYFKQAVEFIGE